MIKGSIKRTKQSDSFDRALKKIDTLEARVGFFENSRYDDGTPVAYVAAIQEYGYPKGNIPMRPFMRPTVITEVDKWAKSAAQGFSLAARGKLPVEEVFEQVGSAAAGDVKQTISEVGTPALKTATIDARKRRLANGGKGSTAGIEKPLRDTGIMFGAVTHEVGTRKAR